jgi:hypothetical protein
MREESIYRVAMGWGMLFLWSASPSHRASFPLSLAEAKDFHCQRLGGAFIEKETVVC